MSGTEILRRDGQFASVPVGPLRDKRAARRSAFETNLAFQLEKALGGHASIREVETVTQALGAAHQRMAHAIDARTSFRFGANRYFVLQAGWATRTGDGRLDALEPFAAKLMSYLPADEMMDIEPRIKAVGAALAKTEISRRHPLDWRLRFNTPWLRFYLNVLSGRDRRGRSNRVTHDRRAPANESFGLAVLAIIATALSLLGFGLIFSTLWTLSELLQSEVGRGALAALFNSSLSSLSAFVSSLSMLFDVS